MDQWQYGIASVGFKWNLSGSYQQVLPRYISVDTEGVEREFLYDALGKESLGLTFLKGYEWPFDTRKLDGSSQVDLLVAAELAKGRRVYLDFTKNPRVWEEETFFALPPEAFWYLQNADCLFGTPIRRLKKLNPKAVELYASHGIDLSCDRLEIAVCAQHINGGVAVDAHWESTVKGLYAAGECAGTFGVYRPGGSALNATQVGSLRAAEHIAAQKDRSLPERFDYTMTVMSDAADVDQLRAIGDELRRGMSLFAAFDRDTERMKELLTRVRGYLEELRVEDTFCYEKFTLWNQLLTTREILSAMLCSAEEVGSHGSALVDHRSPEPNPTPRGTRTMTVQGVSGISPVSPMPDPELWFETLLARIKKEE
jgi:succinate dehydrogenase/fumarate reductase flavoprotein subunit